jgi:hypothetical protein
MMLAKRHPIKPPGFDINLFPDDLHDKTCVKTVIGIGISEAGLMSELAPSATR